MIFYILYKYFNYEFLKIEIKLNTKFSINKIEIKITYSFFDGIITYILFVFISFY